MISIILIGFMGVGKTYVGNRLADYYKCKFIDLDNAIERSEKLSVKDIFRNYGEKYFRQIETNMLNQWDSDGILATGGGIVESGPNREILKNCLSKIFWFNPDFEKTYNRIKKSNRPLILAKNFQQIKDLWIKRLSLYEECADYTLDESFFERIIEILK